MNYNRTWQRIKKEEKEKKKTEHSGRPRSYPWVGKIP